MSYYGGHANDTTLHFCNKIIVSNYFPLAAVDATHRDVRMLHRTTCISGPALARTNVDEAT
jgi:hypothetical protein